MKSERAGAEDVELKSEPEREDPVRRCRRSKYNDWKQETLSYWSTAAAALEVPGTSLTEQITCLVWRTQDVR